MHCNIKNMNPPEYIALKQGGQLLGVLHEFLAKFSASWWSHYMKYIQLLMKQRKLLILLRAVHKLSLRLILVTCEAKCPSPDSSFSLKPHRSPEKGSKCIYCFFFTLINTQNVSTLGHIAIKNHLVAWIIFSPTKLFSSAIHCIQNHTYSTVENAILLFVACIGR